MGGAGRNQWRLAVLSAATALLGVVVGGMLGFFTNRALQEHESETAARGAARVYQEGLFEVAGDLNSMLETRRIASLTTGSAELEAEDKRLMASQMSVDEWAHVLRSESSLRALTTVNAVARASSVDEPMTAEICGVLRGHLHQLVAGADALAELSERGVPADLRDQPADPCSALAS